MEHEPMTRSDSTRRRKAAVVGMAAVIALSIAVPALTFPAAAAAEEFTTGQTPGTTTVQPGTNVTFTVRMLNASADSNSVALDVDLPANWSVVNESTDPNARFRGSAVEWLWFAPASPESTTFTVEYTVRVPSSAGEGSYAVDAQGNFNNGSFFWHNTTSTVMVNAGAPTIANATAADADGDGNVAGGDNVTVSANVTDEVPGVDAVTANASAFGAGQVTLTDADNDSVYDATFAVDASAAAADGAHAVTITANDSSGQANQASTNDLTLDTTGPSIANATAADADGDGNVTGGDSVTVSADVADAGVGVDAVTANASAFGAGQVTLTDADNDSVYDATFAVNASMAAADGAHAVTVRANDTLGNANATATNDLTLDTTGPSITNPTATDADGDGNVAEGDNVTVSADVTDAGVGVDRVGADASDFGAGVVELTDGNGDGTYDATFAVDASMAAANGSYDVTIAANDTLNNTASASTNELQLNTTPADGGGGGDVETVAPGQPGFEAVVAILALLLAALFAARRRD